MKELFHICVDILNWIATQSGVSYEEANIWIFVILHPSLTLLLIVTVIFQHIKIKKLQWQSSRTTK